MEKFPKISIVTPSFNQGQYIEETIQSVLDQGYPNLEYMVIDGGSKDNTVEIIRKYEKYLAYWVSEKDKGQSHAINKGLERCTGEIFNWINSDDYYSGKVFEKVARAFLQPGTKMFCGCSRIFGGDKEWISNGTKLPDHTTGTVVHPSIDQPATFFSMDTVRKFGPLTEQLHYTMDLEWLMKYWLMFGSDGIHRTNEVVVNFREHPGSKTVLFQEKFDQERKKIYQSVLSAYFPGVPAARDYTFPVKDYDTHKVGKDFLARVTNRFFFYQMMEQYGRREFRKAYSWARYILPSVLDPDQKKHYSRIYTRSSVMRLFR